MIESKPVLSISTGTPQYLAIWVAMSMSEPCAVVPSAA